MIIFAHGLEGSPNGSKIRALRNAGFDVVAPDFQGMVLAERVDLLHEICLEYASEQPILAGSSYGGLTAAIVAMRMENAFRGLLLCAPALHLVEPPVDDKPFLLPKWIEDDHHSWLEMILFQFHAVLVCFRSRMNRSISQVNDGHRLAESHQEIIGAAQLLSGETIDS